MKNDNSSSDNIHPSSSLLFDDDDEIPDLISSKVPVTILTGFLGSGKTTLLNYILANENHKLKVAVIVNEFEFGKSIEKGLTLKSGAKSDDEWVELSNGCMCCTAQTQAVMALEKLIRKKCSFDLVLIETAGMADPGNVASMFWQDEALCATLELSGIITVVDAKLITKHLMDPDFKMEATRQLLVADKIILNKMDLVDAEERKVAISTVQAINSFSDIIVTTFSRIDKARSIHQEGRHDISLRDLLFINTTHNFSDDIFLHGISSSSVVGANSNKNNCCNLDINYCKKHSIHNNNHTQQKKQLQHAHSEHITSMSLELINVSAVSRRNVDFMCRDLLYHEGDEDFEIIRMKAVIWIEEDQAQNDNNNNINESTQKVSCDYNNLDKQNENNNNNNNSYERGMMENILKENKDEKVKKTEERCLKPYQLQVICQIFDIMPMAGTVLPPGCVKMLILCRNLNEGRIKEIISKYIR